MNKPTWMDGLLEAERLYKYEDYTIRGLITYLDEERRIVNGDYKWVDWCDGFADYIVNLNIRSKENEQ